MQESIRDIINKYRNAIADATDLTPDLASQYLVELSSYMGNVNERLLEKQMEYNKKKLECLDELKAVGKASMKAECSDEYRNLQEIKGYKDLVVEMTRSLKYYLKAQTEEYQLSYNT